MRSEPFLVVGLGEILWDLLPGGRQLGGAPANCAFHAHALGATGAVVSCVGNDEPGRAILERLQAAGLHTQGIARDPDHPTGTVSVSVNEQGQPTYTIHEGVAWDYLTLTRETLDLACRCDAVCFGSLAQRSAESRQAIADFLKATRPDCLRVFDVNLRQRYYDQDILAASLPLATILKINDEELPVVSRLLGLGGGAVGSMVSALFQTYPQIELLALTRGAKGSALWTRKTYCERPSGPLHRMVDSVGAGDSFAAVLTLGLLRGLPLDRINTLANRVAAYVCSQPGPTPALHAEILNEWGKMR